MVRYSIQKISFSFDRYNKLTLTKMFDHLQVTHSRIVSFGDQIIEQGSLQFKRKNSAHQVKTENNSPKESMTQVATEIDTQNQTSLKLSFLLEEQRLRSHRLAKEVSELKTQICSNAAMNKKEEEEKGKILKEIRSLRESYSELQNEKIHHIEEISTQQIEIDKMRGILAMNEQSLWRLEWENKKNVDEINFQKIMETDIKKEISLLRNKLHYFASTLKDNAHFKEKVKETEQINEIVVEKLKKLGAQMKEMKQDLRISEKKAEATYQMKNKFFQCFEQLRESNDKIKSTSSCIIEKMQKELQIVNSKQKKGIREEEYHKIMENQQKKIKKLVQEMIHLSKKNTELLDSLDMYKRKTDIYEIQPTSVHTNSSFVTKMVKQNHSEIKNLKQEMEIKDDEISRLKETLAISLQTIKVKNEEIDRLGQISKLNKKTEQILKDNEILSLEQKNKALKLRMSEMKENEKKLRKEIGEKDRLIMTYVEDKKSDKK